MPSKKFKSPKILDAGAAQHKEHEKPIWKAVKAGNVDEVLRLCDEDIGVLNKRDPEGAAPIHIAFLYQKNEVGKALVTRYPECALHQYDRRLCNPPAAPGPYAGENILHIAIVHRDFELVEWLLDREPRLLEAEAIGSFFEPGQGTYFGGYPLLFAVASNQFDVVEVILNLKLPPIADDEKAERLERMKSIWLADKYGNTALHLCVVHELEEMYQFCLQKAEEKVHQRAACESKQPLKDQPNAEQLTPLALAAAMGKTSMFNFILEQSIYPAWVYGPVTAKMMPLVGLEQPIVNDDGKVTDAKTALECLISGHSRVTKCLPLDSHGQIDADVYAGRLEIVMLEQVKQLIDKKWQFFGRPEFRRKLRNFLVLQITWTVASVIPNEGQVGKIISIALEVVVGLLVLWKLKSEIQEILVKGIEYFAELRRASAFDNACSLPFNLLYVTGFILRRLSELTEFEGLIPWEDACFGCAALVGWMTMFFFLLGMRTTGPFVIMIREMISNDMYRFGTVYISVLMGFTMSMYMVLGREYNDIRAFFMHMDEFILLGTAGELPASMDDWQGKTNEWYAHALLIAYILFVVVLLLNLLIAMMGSTYSKVDEASTKRWYVEIVGIMVSFEGERKHKEMQIQRNQYAKDRPPEGLTREECTEDQWLQRLQFEYEFKVMDKDWQMKHSETQQKRRQKREESNSTSHVKGANLKRRANRGARADSALLDEDTKDIEEQERRQRERLQVSQADQREYVAQSMAMLNRIQR